LKTVLDVIAWVVKDSGFIRSEQQMHILSPSSAKFLREITYLLCVSAVLAAPFLGQQSAGIEGRVRTARGEVIQSGVEVRLENSGGTLISRQPCDSDGQYQFLGLSQALYRIVVSADGYQTYQEDVDLTNSPRLWTMNVYLNPQEKAETARPVGSLNDQAAPKEARKNYEKGSRALQEKRYREARNRFEKALAEYPCYARAKADLALVDIQERKLANAESELRQATRCDAGYLEAYQRLGQLYDVEKRFAESEAILRAGLRHSPAAWQLYYELGTALYGMGRYEQAEEDYLKAQSFNTDMPSEFHARLAEVYLSTKAYDRAYQEMQAYLRADPNGFYAERIRKVAAKMQSAGVLKSNQPPIVRASPPKP
jgi:tetratricopeptide (TPR) repeat protein